MKKMTTLMIGLKYQKEKAQQAASKVDSLQGALSQYDKANSEPLAIKILDPVEAVDTKTNLDFASLPVIRLNDLAK
jgi:hypothetical protein